MCEREREVGGMPWLSHQHIAPLRHMTVPMRVRKLGPYDVFAVVENRFLEEI